MSSGHKLSGASSILQTMKERSAYVAQDSDSGRSGAGSSREKESEPFELPDGRIITLDRQRSQCTEVLFSPSNILGRESLRGLDEMVVDSLQKCDADIRPLMSENIVLSGGTTLLGGLGARITSTASGRLRGPNATRLKVDAPADRQNLAWIGASILGSLSTYPAMCITRGDYEESGVAVVHKKCFNG